MLRISSGLSPHEFVHFNRQLEKTNQLLRISEIHSVLVGAIFSSMKIINYSNQVSICSQNV